MFIVTGASGQTGFFAADYLLKKGVPVRVVLHDHKKASYWKELGAEVFVADLADPGAMKEAFKNGTAAYLINPPGYFAKDPFAEAEDVARSYVKGLEKSSLKRIVVLSSVGADLPEKTGIIRTTRILEQHIEKTKIPHIFLRCCFFMENWKTALLKFSKEGIFPSLIAPLDHSIPMVSVQDIGNTAGKLMIDEWDQSQVVNLQGPKKYSPKDAAKIAAKLCNLPANPVIIPENQWRQILSAQKFTPKAMEAFIEMYESFNDGTIKFSKGVDMLGEVSLENAFQWMLPLSVTP